jgi:hypothetical protein
MPSNSGSGHFLLCRSSLIHCPHRGIVNHIPKASTTYRIDGRLPMLLTDVYLVVGRPFIAGHSPSPCVEARWVTGSSRLYLEGIPVQTLASVGICSGAGSAGPAIITYCQLGVREPDEPRFIN